MNSKYTINQFVALADSPYEFLVQHVGVRPNRNGRQRSFFDSIVNQFEGECLTYDFRNKVPHKFNGHFNKLPYEQQMKALAEYKRFN